jgi:hypothetical protein
MTIIRDARQLGVALDQIVAYTEAATATASATAPEPR